MFDIFVVSGIIFAALWCLIGLPIRYKITGKEWWED